MSCDELVAALTLANIALLTVGAAGFIGTLAYYQESLVNNAADIRAAIIIYTAFVLATLILPRFFVRCRDTKRQLIITVASLASGIAAVDLGRAIVFARAVAFIPSNITLVDFSPLTYIASSIGTAFMGQLVVWITPQANICTALIASAMGLIAVGIELQIIFFVNRIDT